MYGAERLKGEAQLIAVLTPDRIWSSNLSGGRCRVSFTSVRDGVAGPGLPPVSNNSPSPRRDRINLK